MNVILKQVNYLNNVDSLWLVFSELRQNYPKTELKISSKLFVLKSFRNGRRAGIELTAFLTAFLWKTQIKCQELKFTHKIHFSAKS